MKTLSMRVKDAERKLGRLKEKQKLIKLKADVRRQQALVKRGGVSSATIKGEKKDSRDRKKKPRETGIFSD